MFPRCRYCTNYHVENEKCKISTASIYALVDPRNQEIRYVGRTITDLDMRLRGHVWDAEFDYEGAGKQRLNWLVDLRSNGLQPEIRLLETVDICDLDAELRWMVKLTVEGTELTNAQFIPSKAHFLKTVREKLSEQRQASKQNAAKRPWDTVSDEVQLALLRQALIDTKGNVTRAAGVVGVDRSHANRLLKKFKLVEFAVELRKQHGGIEGVNGRVSGRPRKLSLL